MRIGARCVSRARQPPFSRRRDRPHQNLSVRCAKRCQTPLVVVSAPSSRSLQELLVAGCARRPRPITTKSLGDAPRRCAASEPPGPHRGGMGCRDVVARRVLSAPGVRAPVSTVLAVVLGHRATSVHRTHAAGYCDRSSRQDAPSTAPLTSRCCCGRDPHPWRRPLRHSSAAASIQPAT